MSRISVSLAVVLLACPIPLAAQGVVSTVAGKSGETGLRDGIAQEATFNRPTWLDVDSHNGNLYVVDRANHALRRIAQGHVMTLPFKNWPDYAPFAFNFGGPYGGGVAVEPESAGCGGWEYGEGIYLANSATHQIVLVADGGGEAPWVVPTLREGPAIVGAGTPGALDGYQSVAQFNEPGDIALSWGYVGNYSARSSDRVYVADTSNHTIRQVLMRTYWECSWPSIVETFSGIAGQSGVSDGPREIARFNRPRGVATAPDGSVYVADTGNHTIRRIDADGNVTTVAGKAGVPGSIDGPASISLLHNPSGIDVNERGEVFIADTGNYVIRKLTLDGRLVTIAGQPGVSGYADGPARAALFSGPIGLRLDGTSLFIADTANNVIRKLDMTAAEPRRRATRH